MSFSKTVCSDLLFNALAERKNASKCCHPESQFLSLLSKLLPICCHFYNLCISFYNLWDTFFDLLLRIDIYLHLLNRFALFLDMCPLICEDALLEITVCSVFLECILLIPFFQKALFVPCCSRVLPVDSVFCVVVIIGCEVKVSQNASWCFWLHFLKYQHICN